MSINLKCIAGKKATDGRIEYYVLQDSEEKTYHVTPSDLRQRIRSHYYYVENMILSERGRLKVVSYKVPKKVYHWNKYHIMHGNRKVASIHKNGTCRIYTRKFMPFNLYLEQAAEDDVDMRVQNLANFYYWCASRVLTLDREYAKEIMNSIGASQSANDKDRAQIALSYHCLSLTDIYWTKESYEHQSFEKINLFQNHLKSAFVDVALRGKQMTIENSHLIADDLSTQGCFPKAWVRRKNGFYLMKDGGESSVERELLASRIAQCFRLNQVKYEEEVYDGQRVSVSKLITSPEYSIVSMEYYDIYCMNHEKDKMKTILKLDGYSYYMMNIIDYLVGNTDRHWGNWGVLVDNTSNKPIRLYDLMDFNKAFLSYDTIEGTHCLTVMDKKSQKEAAIEAVKKVGLNQIREIKEDWFCDAQIKKMFFQRLCLLKEQQ